MSRPLDRRELLRNTSLAGIGVLLSGSGMTAADRSPNEKLDIACIGLGNVAYRLGRRFEWDPVNLKATNCVEAEQYVKRDYREGWTL
ncbi:MAG: hypothetical protein ABIP48_28295 [Planctomycetota bacterium]